MRRLALLEILLDQSSIKQMTRTKRSREVAPLPAGRPPPQAHRVPPTVTIQQAARLTSPEPIALMPGQAMRELDHWSVIARRKTQAVATPDCASESSPRMRRAARRAHRARSSINATRDLKCLGLTARLRGPHLQQAHARALAPTTMCRMARAHRARIRLREQMTKLPEMIRVRAGRQF